MDGAAKSIEQLAQRILPDRPYHLAVSGTSRYPEPKGFWFTGPSLHLQYMTFISGADRGILFTRPGFDIEEQPESAAPTMHAKMLAKGEPKKKMSFKDYQNRKKSASPPDNEASAKAEVKANGAVDTKARKENGIAEEPKDREKTDKRPEARPDPPAEKPRVGQNGDRYVVIERVILWRTVGLGQATGDGDDGLHVNR